MNQLKALNKEVEIKVDMKMVEKAIVFAKKWHDGQMRKIGNIPCLFSPSCSCWDSC